MDYSSAGVLVCGEAEDRGLPLGSMRDVNDATRQKNQLDSPDPEGNWYQP